MGLHDHQSQHLSIEGSLGTHLDGQHDGNVRRKQGRPSAKDDEELAAIAGTMSCKSTRESGKTHLVIAPTDTLTDPRTMMATLDQKIISDRILVQRLPDTHSIARTHVPQCRQ